MITLFQEELIRNNPPFSSSPSSFSHTFLLGNGEDRLCMLVLFLAGFFCSEKVPSSLHTIVPPVRKGQYFLPLSTIATWNGKKMCETNPFMCLYWSANTATPSHALDGFSSASPPVSSIGMVIAGSYLLGCSPRAGTSLVASPGLLRT